MSMHQARVTSRPVVPASSRSGPDREEIGHAVAAAVLWCVDCGSEEQFDAMDAGETVEGMTAPPDAARDVATEQLLFVELLCRGCGAGSVLGMLAALPRASEARAPFARTA